MGIQEEHFDIDEVGNLIDNLEMVVHFLELPTPLKWKWVAIALHQALYGALISALQGTNARQTVIDRASSEAFSLFLQGVPVETIASRFNKDETTIRRWISDPYVISLTKALKRARKKKHLPFCETLVTTREEEDAISRLTAVRNEFEHFFPQTLIIHTTGMPGLIRHVLRVIRFLGLESNCVTMSDEQERRLTFALDAIESILNTQHHQAGNAADKGLAAGDERSSR